MSVIRVFNNPAITMTLTVVLLLGTSYHFLQAARPHHLTERVNQVLHALMNILMAAMLWNLAPSTILAQIGVLAAAALWFVLQAVARPEFKMMCAGSQSRLKCVYHSATMAAAALMIAMMAHTASGQSGDAVKAATSHAHHTMTSQAQTPTAAQLNMSAGPAMLLTLFFTTAALVFLTLLVRQKTALLGWSVRSSAIKNANRKGHAHEALAAGLMALMFGTMTV